MVTQYLIIMYYFEPQLLLLFSLVNTFNGVEVDSFDELNGGHLLKCVEVENFEELKGDLNYLDMYLYTS